MTEWVLLWGFRKGRLIEFVDHVSFISLINFHYSSLNCQKYSENKIMIINKEQSSQSLIHRFKNNLEKPLAQGSAQGKKQTFISRVERFTTQNQPTPGPGTYDSSNHEKHTLDFKAKRDNDNSKGIPIQHAWISDHSRLSFLVPQASQSRLGPGQYVDSLDKGQNNHNHSNWAKVSRFQQTTAFQNKLGPGQYYQTDNYKKKIAPLSVFKSKSPRTFIDELMVQTKKESKLKRSNPQEEEIPDEIIRFDETQYPAVRKIDKKSPVFMSKSQRPELIYESSASNLGPGHYSIDKLEGFRSMIRKGPRSGIHYSLGPLQTGMKSKTSELGPGSYNLDNSNSLQKLTRRQPLGVIPKEERFKSISLKRSSLPGPGEYMQKRFTMIVEEELRLKNKGSFVRKPEKIHNFGTAPRSTLRNVNEVPFGQYQVQNFDIQHRLKKQKEQYQKLRMMEVTLPAFNSKQHA